MSSSPSAITRRTTPTQRVLTCSGVIAKQAPRFDATFLAKANAYQRVRDKGDVYLV